MYASLGLNELTLRLNVIITIITYGYELNDRAMPTDVEQ